MTLDPLPYALLAQAAYTAVPAIGNENSAARVVVTNTEEAAVFAIPGTDNIACWLADLDISTVQDDLGRLHAGFRNAAATIEDAVITAARAAARPVILVGHSEGADLALILAGRMCLAGIPPYAVFAFEPARLTTDTVLGDLLRSYAVYLYLSRNGEDAVPLIPRAIENWQHVDALTQIGTAFDPFPNIEDHKMAAVVKALGG